MQGMMSHQGLGQQLVHPAPGGGAQMQGQWRQPLTGQQTPLTEEDRVDKVLENESADVLIEG